MRIYSVEVRTNWMVNKDCKDKMVTKECTLFQNYEDALELSRELAEFLSHYDTSDRVFLTEREVFTSMESALDLDAPKDIEWEITAGEGFHVAH